MILLTTLNRSRKNFCFVPDLSSGRGISSALLLTLLPGAELWKGHKLLLGPLTAMVFPYSAVGALPSLCDALPVERGKALKSHTIIHCYYYYPTHPLPLTAAAPLWVPAPPPPPHDRRADRRRAPSVGPSPPPRPPRWGCGGLPVAASQLLPHRDWDAPTPPP